MSIQERRKAKKQARAPATAREEGGGEEAPSEAKSKKLKSSLRQAAPSGFGSPNVQHEPITLTLTCYSP